MMESSTSRAPSRRETLLPALAVAAVAFVAVLAAVMVKRVENPGAPITASVDPNTVITAPPLAAPNTRSMGGAAACGDCGVVQMVVAVNDTGGKVPRAYQMHIRMDDGSTRTVEQRGALAAGSRVKLEGSTLKPVS
jgi:hypothetical protein